MSLHQSSKQDHSPNKHQTMHCVRESGVPLGGIGAGKIDICPDGAFRNLTCQNNLDWPYSGDGDEVNLMTGHKADAWSEGGLSEAFMAAAVEGAGAKC